MEEERGNWGFDPDFPADWNNYKYQPEESSTQAEILFLQSELGTDWYTYKYQSEKSDLCKAIESGLIPMPGEEVNQTQKTYVEVETRDQRESDLWWMMRNFRITASNIGPILRARSTKAIRAINNRKPFSCRAVNWGQVHEKTAIR